MVSLRKQKTFLNKVTDYICNYRYMLLLALCAIATYGYFLTHYAVSADDLSGDRYYFGELFAQGRFTNTILHHLFGFIDNSSWIRDLFGLMLLCGAAIVFCVLFDELVTFKTNLPKVMFSCLLISAPIFTEIFSYNGTCISIGGGFLFIALALYCTLVSKKEKRLKYLLGASALIAVTASWYESLLVVYVEAVFALLILQYITATEKIKLKTIVLDGLYFAIPVVAGVIAELLFQIAVMGIFDITKSENVTNTIELISLGTLKSIVLRIGKTFFLSALWNKSIAIFVMSFVSAGLLGVCYCVKKKSLVPLLLFAGLAFSNFILCFLSANSVAYRMCQCFAFLTAFIVLLVLLIFDNSQKHSKKALHKIFSAAMVYLLIVQISTSNYWYFWDYQRYVEEANTVNHIAITLADNYDISKPIVFTGQYELSDEVLEHSYVTTDSFAYKVTNGIQERLSLGSVNTNGTRFAMRKTQSIVSSYINWGIRAFDVKNLELFKFFEFHGIDYLKLGTGEMYEEAKEFAADMPQWPQQGSIVDMGEYIIVNF